MKISKKNLAVTGLALMVPASMPYMPEQCAPAPDNPPNISVIRDIAPTVDGARFIVSGDEGWANGTIQCKSYYGTYSFVESKDYYWGGDTTGDFDDFGSFYVKCDSQHPVIVDTFTYVWS